MDRIDTSCLIESKKEYTNLLVRKIKMPILNVIMDSFKTVKDTCSYSRDEDKLLIYFQDYLEKIPEWDTIKIEETTATIINQSKCDYLEDVLFAVFILHTRIFDAIEPTPDTNKSKIVFPNLSNFIFQTLVDVAREHWKYVYLFKEAKSSCHYQENRNKCENIIDNCILNTITEMLPVRDILQDHIHKYNNTHNDDEDDGDDEIDLKLPQLNRINKIKGKKLLKKIQNGGGVNPFGFDDVSASPYPTESSTQPIHPSVPPLFPQPDTVMPPHTSTQTSAAIPVQIPEPLPTTPPVQNLHSNNHPHIMNDTKSVDVDLSTNISDNLLDTIGSTHVVGQGENDSSQIKTVQFTDPITSNVSNLDSVSSLNDMEAISYE